MLGWILGSFAVYALIACFVLLVVCITSSRFSDETEKTNTFYGGRDEQVQA